MGINRQKIENVLIQALHSIIFSAGCITVLIPMDRTPKYSVYGFLERFGMRLVFG